MTRPAAIAPVVLPAPLQSFVTDPDHITHAAHLPQLQTLALQIQHNLQYQHYWTQLQVHTHSPLTNRPLPRPLVSGLPPQRLYIHPDEQVELLKNADRDRKAGKQAAGNNALELKAGPEREWILPTRLSEKWTLRRLAEIFDSIGIIPPAPEDAASEEDSPSNPWRTTKRVTLASVDTDSTVVYYIIHDGVMKPRQN